MLPAHIIHGSVLLFYSFHVTIEIGILPTGAFLSYFFVFESLWQSVGCSVCNMCHKARECSMQDGFLSLGSSSFILRDACQLYSQVFEAWSHHLMPETWSLCCVEFPNLTKKPKASVSRTLYSLINVLY